MGRGVICCLLCSLSRAFCSALGSCIQQGEKCNPISISGAEFEWYSQGNCCGQQGEVFCDLPSLNTSDVAAYYGNGLNGTGVCGPGASFGRLWSTSATAPLTSGPVLPTMWLNNSQFPNQSASTADHGCPFYPSYSNSDLQPFNFDFQPSTPVGDKSLILPGYEVVSYCCPGLSRVTGFEIWNASWYSPTNDAYIAAVAALCDDGSGTPYVTSFVEPKVSGGSALSTSCDEKITSYFVEGFTALPDASDQNWIRHSLAGDSYARIIDGFGTAGNDTELTLINAQCAESEALLGFRAAPGCLGITQFQFICGPNDPQTIRGNDASRPKVPNPSPLAPPPVSGSGGTGGGGCGIVAIDGGTVNSCTGSFGK